MDVWLNNSGSKRVGALGGVSGWGSVLFGSGSGGLWVALVALGQWPTTLQYPFVQRWLLPHCFISIRSISRSASIFYSCQPAAVHNQSPFINLDLLPCLELR